MTEKTPEQEKNINKSIGERIRLTNELLKNSDKLGLSQERVNELQQQELQLRIDAIQATAEDLSLSEEQRIKAQQKLALRKQELEALQAQTAEMKRQEQLQNQLGKSIESLANKWRGGMVEGILEAGVNFKQLGESIKKSVTLTNLAGTAMQTMVQSTLATAVMFDQAQSSFAAATGAGREYSDVISDVSRGSSAMGVGVKESAAAVGDLYTGMSLFSSQNKSTQVELARTTAELGRLGISGATSAANMEFSMRVMGETADQAAASAEDLAKFAIGIGSAPAKMAEEFKQAGPKLAVYGKNATKVFKGLASQAKKTGIEMNSLLGIAEQFDTFEGAAKAAGSLNSILGGPYLDSVKMLNMTEDERIAALQESISLSGKSFDSMSRHEKKALANAAGITDMSVANNMFSESARIAAAGQEEQAVSAEELAKRQKATVAITEKLNMLMQQFAVAVEPIVNGLASLLEGLLAVNDFFGGYFLPVLGTVIMVSFLAAKFLGLMATASVALGSAAPAATPGLVALGQGFKGLGTAVSHPKVMLGLAIVSLLMLSIGAAVLMAAFGVSLVLKEFANLIPVMKENIDVMPYFLATIYGLVIGLALLATIGTAGAAALVLISIAALGLSLMLGMVLGDVVEAANAIGSMFDKINSFESDGPFLKLINVITAVEDTAVDNLEGLMDQADRLVTIQAKLTALEATQAVGNAINKLISFVAPEASDASDERKREIILQLNNREFGRAVVEALDNDMKLSLA